MKGKGVDEIFFAGTSLTDMVDYVKKHYGKRRKSRAKLKPDLFLARNLPQLEDAAGKRYPRAKHKTSSIKNRTSKVFGITGPAGAGKTRQIKKLVLRSSTKDR